MEAGYPTGASADAMYYDTNSSRTGWYALGAFVALILFWLMPLLSRQLSELVQQLPAIIGARHREQHVEEIPHITQVQIRIDVWKAL